MTVEEIADKMYKMVEEAQGMGKKLKPMDLTKAITKEHDDVDKKQAKEALKNLINDGKLVYTYFGGSYVEIPHREGAAND